MKADIQKIYFNLYGYVITFENIPVVIARLYEVFTEFKDIQDRSIRKEVFLREENLRFIMNYKYNAFTDSLKLSEILDHFRDLSDIEKEFYKLRL